MESLRPIRFQTMSKYGRLNFDTGTRMHEEKQINNLLSDIKNISTGFSGKKRSNSVDDKIMKRLLSPAKRIRKARKRILPKSKLYKHAPTISQASPRVEIVSEVPGSAQYNPNYDAYLPKTNTYSIQSLHQKIPVDPRIMTMTEMIKAWEKHIRLVDFKEEPNEGPLPDVSLPSKPVYNSPGVVARTTSHEDSIIRKTDAPAPDKYYIPRELDKPRVIPFDGQSTRKEIETLTDRTHMKLAQSIDSVKPRNSGCIPFDKQLAREKGLSQEDDIWKEIEEEQKSLLKILKPQKDVSKPPPKIVEPFKLQPSRLQKGPFNHMIHQEAPQDAQYNVEYSLSKLESKKIPPATNFGSRVSKDRVILNKSEAPDRIYPNVIDGWKKTAKSYGSPPDFKNMHDRKSAYDYMPKTCGGNFTFVDDNVWSYKTPVVMDQMGERKIILEVPPQFLQGKSSNLVISKFPK